MKPSSLLRLPFRVSYVEQGGTRKNERFITVSKSKPVGGLLFKTRCLQLA